MVYTRQVSTPLGEILLEGTESALTHLHLPGHQRLTCPQSTPLLDRAGQQLQAYFSGDLREFSLPLAPAGTPFQQKVWRCLCTIPYGETWSYGDLAAEVGCPGGPRAVGSANGKNPLPILIPCHRVVTAKKTLGGYSGGLSTKITLLTLEKVEHIDFYS